YWYVIATYIIMQLASALIPVVIGVIFQYDINELITFSIYTNIFLFIIAATIVIWMMWKDFHEERLAHPMSVGKIIGWVALGLLLAWVAQLVASVIQFLIFGGNPASE